MQNTRYAALNGELAAMTDTPRRFDAVHSSPRQPHGNNQPANVTKDRACEKSNFDGLHFRGLAARRRPRLKLWLRVLGKWLITVVFIAVIYTILGVYEKHLVITEKQKKRFNALITGFLIALGLITTSQLIGATADLRWWILSRRPRSRGKVRAILYADSLANALALASKSSRLSIHLSVAAWVVLLLGSQIGYASLGLCYSVEKTEDRALLVPGRVAIANLSTVETQKIASSTNATKAQQYTANSYGIISLAFNVGQPEDMPVPGSLWSNDDNDIFCGTNSCSYVFREINNATLSDQSAIPVIATTNRDVNASAQCSSHRVVRGGTGTNSTIIIMSGSQEVEIEFPSQNGADQSTFMTSMNETCGDGCSVVRAFEASPTNPWFYNCTTYLGPVTNATRPEHQLGTSLARLATAAIALQGYTTSGGNQSISYPAETFFGTPLNGSTESMELLLSRFTIGVVSSVAGSNGYIVVNGQAPTIGQKLHIGHWGYIHLIFALTAGLQLLFAVLVTAVAERVVVPEQDPLAEAKVLRDMVSTDDAQTVTRKTGNGLSGGEDRSLWIYRNRYIGDGLYDLYMERAEYS